MDVPKKHVFPMVYFGIHQFGLVCMEGLINMFPNLPLILQRFCMALYKWAPKHVSPMVYFGTVLYELAQTCPPPWYALVWFSLIWCYMDWLIIYVFHSLILWHGWIYFGLVWYFGLIWNDWWTCLSTSAPWYTRKTLWIAKSCNSFRISSHWHAFKRATLVWIGW